MKIRNKITAIIGIGLISALIINAIFIYNFIFNHIRKIIIQSYVDDSINKLDKLDRLIFERIGDLNAII
nr:hypothetical protein [bacterium]